MNNDYKTKRTMYGILTLLSAILFISPVDLMSGMQIDDIAYILTGIISAILQFKAMKPDYKEADN